MSGAWGHKRTLDPEKAQHRLSQCAGMSPEDCRASDAGSVVLTRNTSTDPSGHSDRKTVAR
jgi:hypothetical protein